MGSPTSMLCAMQTALSQLCASSLLSVASSISLQRQLPGHGSACPLISQPCVNVITGRRPCHHQSRAPRGPAPIYCYRSSSDDEAYQDTFQQQWESEVSIGQSPSPPPTVPNDRSTSNIGMILLGAAALLAALIAWFLKSRRPKPGQQDAWQPSPPGHRNPPQTEMELDNTVRTLTEQRLEHVSSNQGMPSALLRQPAEATWRQQGVGQFTCKTRLYPQQPASRQYTEHVVSGSAAIMLVKLQLQYLVFLKQSDSIRGLRQKAEPVTVQ